MGDLAWSLVLAMVVVLAVAAVALTPWLTRDRVIRGMTLQRFVIFTVDGGVFDGLLSRCDERTFVFVDVHDRSQLVPVPAVGGEFLIERTRIAYAQRLAVDGAPAMAPQAPAMPGPGAPVANPTLASPNPGEPLASWPPYPAPENPDTVEPRIPAAA